MALAMGCVCSIGMTEAVEVGEVLDGCLVPLEGRLRDDLGDASRVSRLVTAMARICGSIIEA